MTPTDPLRALVAAVEAFIADATEIAMTSLREWTGVQRGWRWDDEVWKRNDPDGFALVEQGRNALTAAQAALATRQIAPMGAETIPEKQPVAPPPTTANPSPDTMRPEYDMRGGERGRYADAYQVALSEAAPPDEVVERVARAIYETGERLRADDDVPGSPWTPWDRQTSHRERRIVYEQARAALAAMEQPK